MTTRLCWPPVWSPAGLCLFPPQNTQKSPEFQLTWQRMPSWGLTLIKKPPMILLETESKNERKPGEEKTYFLHSKPEHRVRKARGGRIKASGHPDQPPAWQEPTVLLLHSGLWRQPAITAKNLCKFGNINKLQKCYWKLERHRGGTGTWACTVIITTVWFYFMKYQRSIKKNLLWIKGFKLNILKILLFCSLRLNKAEKTPSDSC